MSKKFACRVRVAVSIAAALALASFSAVIATAPAQSATAAATSVTLGSTTLPSGSTMGPACSTSTNAEVFQASTDSSYKYAVPAGGGTITSWSFNKSGATAGTPYTLAVVRPSGGNYTMVGTDSEVVPSSSSSVATFTLAHPIKVQAGDVLGVMVTAGKNTVDCRFKGGPISNNDVVGSGFASSTAPGTSFSESQAIANELVNVAATMVPGSAVSLGTTTLPSGSTMGPACSASANAEVFQASTDSSYNYTVPSGGGTITSWSFNKSGATAGTPYTLAVVRPSGGNYSIVGTDTEVVPSSSSSVATFTLSNPITVKAGDVLGVMVTAGKNTVDCRFKGGPISNNDVVGSGFASSTSPGSSFSESQAIANELVNVAATVVQGSDVGITEHTAQSPIAQGGVGAFEVGVTESGSSSSTVTVTDTVPSGLSILYVAAGTAPCSISGQSVSCTLSGAPAKIAILVSGTTSGTYTNTVKAQGTLPDSNTANNAASAKLTVS